MAEKIPGFENIAVDADGFLENPADWTPEVAQAIAKTLNMDLTDRHWVVINYARKEYETTGEAPTLRKITKQTDVDTKEIYNLFPGGPGKLAAKVAGLKKPTGCI
jgi:tRNA 2-thiouridine synthesizing protein E